MSKPNRNNKYEQDNNKRPLESNDGNATLVSTPKKKALDVFRAKILTTPEKVYNRKYGVVLTKVIEEDGTVVGLTIEGAYLARSYLLGLMNSTYLDLLAYQSKKKLEMLPIRGKFWRQESVISILSPSMSISDANYMVSKTTKEQGNGAVLLFTALQLLEEDGEKDFGMDVYDKVKRFFKETKMPPDDQSSASGFIKSSEQAYQKWNEWSPWTVTEEEFELTTANYVDAFLQIADNNKV
jgi:hypothetical protein